MTTYKFKYNEDTITIHATNYEAALYKLIEGTKHPAADWLLVPEEESVAELNNWLNRPTDTVVIGEPYTPENCYIRDEAAMCNLQDNQADDTDKLYPRLDNPITGDLDEIERQHYIRTR